MHTNDTITEARFLLSRYHAWTEIAQEQRTAHEQLLEDYRRSTLPGGRHAMTFQQMCAEGDRILATMRAAQSTADDLLDQAARALDMPTL